MVKHRCRKGSSRSDSRNNTPSSSSHSGSEQRVSTTSSSNSRSGRSRHDTATSDRSRSNSQRTRSGGGGTANDSTSPSFVHVPISTRRHRSERTAGGASSVTVGGHRSSASSPLLDSPHAGLRSAHPVVKSGRPSPTRQPPLHVKLRIGTSSSSAASASATSSPTPARLPVPPSNDEEEEDPCPICLDKRTDEAAILYCMHRYCFQCIKRWAEGSNNTCPLCKMIFSEIAFNIQSDSSYDVYKIKQRRVMLPSRNLVLLDHTDAARPHSTRLGLGVPSSGRPEGAHVQLQLRRQLLMMAMHGMRGESVSEARLEWYQTERRTLVPSQYQYCPTPEDFSNNETLFHRVVPFLVRELVAIFAIAEPIRDWLINDIRALLRAYHVESDGFEIQIRNVFNDRIGNSVSYPRHYIDIFIDELRSFVLYNHELEDFDRLTSVSRVRRRPNPTLDTNSLTDRLMRYAAARDEQRNYLGMRDAASVLRTQVPLGGRQQEFSLRRTAARVDQIYGGSSFSLGHNLRSSHYSSTGDLSNGSSNGRTAGATITLGPPDPSAADPPRSNSRWPDQYFSLLDFVSSSYGSSQTPAAAAAAAANSSQQRPPRPEEAPQRPDPAPAQRMGSLDAALNSLSVRPFELFTPSEPITQPLESARRSSPWQPLACPWSPTPLHGHAARPGRQSSGEEGSSSVARDAGPPRPASPEARSSLERFYASQPERPYDITPSNSSPLGVSVGYGLDLPSPPIEPSTSSAAAAAPPPMPIPSAAPADSHGEAALRPVPVIEISSEEEMEIRIFQPRSSRVDEDCVILSQSVALSSEDEAASAQQPRPSSSREVAGGSSGATDGGAVGVSGGGHAAPDESNPWRPWQGHRRRRRDPTISELIAYKKQRASSASDSSDDSSAESSASSDSSFAASGPARRARDSRTSQLEWGSSVYFHSHQSRVDERRRRRNMRQRQRFCLEGFRAPRRCQKPSPPSLPRPLSPLPPSASLLHRRAAPDTSVAPEPASTSLCPRGAGDPVKRSCSPEPDSCGGLEPGASSGGGSGDVLAALGAQSPQLLNAAEVGRVFADLELEMGAASTTESSEEERGARRGPTAASSSTYAYPIELDAMLAAAGPPPPPQQPEPESSTGDVRLEEPTVSEAPPAVLLEPCPRAKREPRPQSPSSTSGASPVKLARLPVRPRPRIPKLGFTFINLTGEEESGRRASGSAARAGRHGNRQSSSGSGGGGGDAVELDAAAGVSGASTGEAGAVKDAVRRSVTALRRRVRAQPELAGVSDAVVMETLSCIARPPKPGRRRAGFPRWRERPRHAHAVVDLVASDNEEAAAPKEKKKKEEKKEKKEAPVVRRKMRAGCDARPVTPPIVDLVEEDEPCEEAGASEKPRSRRASAEGAEEKAAEDLRALEFVYPRTTDEFYRALRGESVPAAAVAAAPTPLPPKEGGAPRKKLKLASEAPVVSDADNLSSIVEEMDIEDHRVAAGKEKAAMGADKRHTQGEVEAMEVDYIPEPEPPRKEAIRSDRELPLPESMEVELAPVTPGGGKEAEKKSGKTARRGPRRRWHSLSDVGAPSVRDAGTSPSQTEAELEPEKPSTASSACRCCADKETMSRCTQTDSPFCLLSFLPTSCAPGLSSTFISSTTTSSLSVALNLTAFSSTQTTASLALSPKPLGGALKARRTAKRSVSESALEGRQRGNEAEGMRRASSVAMIG